MVADALDRFAAEGLRIIGYWMIVALAWHIGQHLTQPTAESSAHGPLARSLRAIGYGFLPAAFLVTATPRPASVARGVCFLAVAVLAAVCVTPKSEP